MKIAMTGASGFVGGALVRRLVAEGNDVIRLVRRRAERPDEVEWHLRPNDVELCRRLEGVDGVVNLAGSNLAGGRWTAVRKDEIRRSRIEGTRALVAVMKRLGNPQPAFVSASAVGYYGNRAEEELTEESGPGGGFLAEVCQAWEQEAEAAASAGIRCVLLRLGMVLGKGGGVLARLVPVYRAGFGGPLGRGRQWVSWVTLDDAAGAAVHALREPGLAGPVNAVAPTPVRNEELSGALARALDRRTFLSTPAFVLRAAFGEMADEMLLASARVRPQRLLETGFRFMHPELGAALRDALATG
jgi:hypothetical protein